MPRTFALAFSLLTLAACGAASDATDEPGASAPETGDDTQTDSTGSAATTPPAVAGPTTPAASDKPSLPSYLAGTNLSGLEFNSGKKPGKAYFDFGVPTHAEVDYFIGKGMRFFRIPFLWERMQPKARGPFADEYFGLVQDLVSYVTSKGGYALVDPHNYGSYYGKKIGSGEAGAATADDFGAFWAELAKRFSSDPKVVFGLMNEPSGMSTKLWLDDANVAIAAIRATGAKNVLTVPGTLWTGAHSWVKSDNGTVMLGVVDPLDNWIYEVHQYLDVDSSGTHDTCPNTETGSKAIASFTAWLDEHGKRAMLGEFGAANNATCLAGLEKMLALMDAKKDRWAGYTYWSAGPWWGDYMYSIEPSKDGRDAPQMATLLKHL